MEDFKISNFRSYGFISTITENIRYSFHKCLFSSSNRATPIAADSIDAILSFEECQFDSIRGNLAGGCIHVDCSSNNFELIIKHVIANDCETKNQRGSFLYILCVGDCSLNETIINRCSPSHSEEYYTLLLSCINAFYWGGNTTHCYANSDLLTFQSTTSILKWCQFKNNELDKQGVIIYQKGTCFIKYASLIGNNMYNPTMNGGIIFITSGLNLTISDSYFMQNSGQYIISSSIDYCIVINCVIDNWLPRGVKSSSGLTTSGEIPITIEVGLINIPKFCSKITINQRIRCFCSSLIFSFINIR